MSEAGGDFLFLLAARATGAMPLVEPRLPSLFEHDAGSARAQTQSEDAFEQAIETESPWSAPSLRRAAVRPQPLPPRDLPEEPVQSPAAAAPPRLASGPVAPPEPLARTEAPIPSQKPHPRPIATAEAMPASAPPTILVPRRPVSDDAALITPHGRMAPAESIVPTAARPVPPRPPLDPALPPVRHPAQTLPAAEPKATPPTVRPIPTPRIAPPAQARTRRQPTPVAPPETVVNIVIGRVEVCAHTAPGLRSPPPRPVAAPPPQSLADYLRTRESAR